MCHLRAILRSKSGSNHLTASTCSASPRRQLLLWQLHLRKPRRCPRFESEFAPATRTVAHLKMTSSSVLSVSASIVGLISIPETMIAMQSAKLKRHVSIGLWTLTTTSRLCLARETSIVITKKRRALPATVPHMHAASLQISRRHAHPSRSQRR